MENGRTAVSSWASLSQKSALGLAMTLTSDLDNLSAILVGVMNICGTFH